MLVLFASISICFGEAEKSFDQSKEYCHEELQEDEFFASVGKTSNTWKSLFPRIQTLYACQKKGDSVSQECYKGAWGCYRRIEAGENNEDDEICRYLKEKNNRFATAINDLGIEKGQDIYLEVNNPDVGTIARYLYGYNSDYSSKNITITNDSQVSYKEFTDEEQAAKLKKVLDILFFKSNKKYTIFRGEIPSDYENMRFTIRQNRGKFDLEVQDDGQYELSKKKEVLSCSYCIKSHIPIFSANINPQNFICKKLLELHNNPFRNTIDNNNKEDPIHVEFGGIIKNREFVFDTVIFESGDDVLENDSNRLKIYADGTIEYLHGNCDELLHAARTYISSDERLRLYFASFIELTKRA